MSVTIAAGKQEKLAVEGLWLVLTSVLGDAELVVDGVGYAVGTSDQFEVPHEVDEIILRESSGTASVEVNFRWAPWKLYSGGQSINLSAASIEALGQEIGEDLTVNASVTPEAMTIAPGQSLSVDNLPAVQDVDVTSLPAIQFAPAQSVNVGNLPVEQSVKINPRGTYAGLPKHVSAANAEAIAGNADRLRLFLHAPAGNAGPVWIGGTAADEGIPLQPNADGSVEGSAAVSVYFENIGDALCLAEMAE